MLDAARDEVDLDVLLRDWSLTKSDLLEIQRARSQGRLWTALHLCSLRRTGRFADAPERIPHEAIVHLAQQIGIHPPARLAVLPRQATDSAIRNRVREYLGFVPFSADAETRLTARLAELALDGLGSAELVERAEAFLLTAHVVLPARATLERLVASLNRQALDALFTRIAGRFSASTRVAFDRLVGNADDDDAEVDGKATVGRYRTPPASSMGRFTRTAGERLEEINALLRDLPDLSDIPHRVVRQLAELCRRYDGHALRRFPAAKRYSLLACFLLDRRQGLLDDMVQAHDNHMTGLMRRARHAAEADARQLRQAAEAGLVTLIDTGEAVFTGDREESVAGLRERIGADRLEKALMACRAVAANDARGVVDAVIARYPDLRKSLPAFWSLPFTSDTGRDDLLAALDVVRRLDQGAIKALPDDVPTDFVPAGWQRALRDDRGQLRRSLWETALALAVRNALRSGDLHLPHSRQHAGFWSLVLDERRWASSRAACYAELGLTDQSFPTDSALQVALAAELAAVIEGLVPRLAQHLIRLRYEEDVEAVVVRGLPAEEELVPAVALALSCLFGLPFNYQSQLNGALAMRLVPSDDSAPNTNTTRDEFEWHSDDAYMAAALRVTWITLYGVRNPPQTLTGYASIRAALAGMAADEVALLWAPRYRVRAPTSFKLGKERWSEPRPILTLDEEAIINIAWPTYATRLADPGDGAAAHALSALKKQVARQGVYPPVGLGEVLPNGQTYRRQTGLRASRDTCSAVIPLYDLAEVAR
jgi:Domain of unknown function (DUF4158)